MKLRIVELRPLFLIGQMNDLRVFVLRDLHILLVRGVDCLFHGQLRQGHSHVGVVYCRGSIDYLIRDDVDVSVFLHSLGRSLV